MQKACNSLNWAKSSFNRPATDFIALVCAEPPTRDTDNPTFTAGRIYLESDLFYAGIRPAVIEITFVGIYADTSPACVSIIGKAVSEPPP